MAPRFETVGTGVRCYDSESEEKLSRKEWMDFACEKFGKAAADEMETQVADYLYTRIERKFKGERNARYIFRVTLGDRTIYVVATDKVEAVVLAQRDFGNPAPSVTVEMLAEVINGEVPSGLIAA